VFLQRYNIIHAARIYLITQRYTFLLIKDHRKINVIQACPGNGSRRYPGAIGLHWMNSKEVPHFDGTHRCLRINSVHDLNLNPLTIGQNDGNNSSCSFFYPDYSAETHRVGNRIISSKLVETRHEKALH